MTITCFQTQSVQEKQCYCLINSLKTDNNLKYIKQWSSYRAVNPLYVSAIKSNQLMLHMEIIAVCSKNHTKTSKCILRAEPIILNVKHGGTQSNHQAHELKKKQCRSEVTDLFHNCYKSVLSLATLPIFDICSLRTLTKTNAALRRHRSAPSNSKRQRVSKFYLTSKAQPPYEMCFFKQKGEDGQRPIYTYHSVHNLNFSPATPSGN